MDKVIPLINGAGILLIICLLVFIKTGKIIVDDMIGPQTREKSSTFSLRAAFHSGMQIQKQLGGVLDCVTDFLIVYASDYGNAR